MSGGRYGPTDDEEAIKTIHVALQLGISSFDTAPAYGDGHAEEILGRALAGRRKTAFITTKGGIGRRNGKPGPDSRRESLMRGIEDSLHRLRTEYVDVYLIHWPDPATPLDETMAALDASLNFAWSARASPAHSTMPTTKNRTA